MSTGFFNAIEEVIALLKSQPFKNLYTLDKYHEYRPERKDPDHAEKYSKEYARSAGRKLEIDNIHRQLNRLLHTYNDLINELDDISKYTDPTKDLDRLKDFQIDLDTFFKDLGQTVKLIEEAKQLPDTPKEQLSKTLREKAENVKSVLTEYYNVSNDVLTSLDLKSRINTLRKNAAKLDASLKKTTSTKHKSTFAFDLNKEGSETLDLKGAEQSSKDLIKSEKSSIDHQIEKKNKYFIKTLKHAALCLLVIPLPLCAYYAAMYGAKHEKHKKKIDVHRERLRNLNQITKDLESVQGALTILKKNPDTISPEQEKEVEENFHAQKEKLKDAVHHLSEQLEVDKSERHKHGPTAHGRPSRF